MHNLQIQNTAEIEIIRSTEAGRSWTERDYNLLCRTDSIDSINPNKIISPKIFIPRKGEETETRSSSFFRYTLRQRYNIHDLYRNQKQFKYITSKQVIKGRTNNKSGFIIDNNKLIAYIIQNSNFINKISNLHSVECIRTDNPYKRDINSKDYDNRHINIIYSMEYMAGLNEFKEGLREVMELRNKLKGNQWFRKYLEFKNENKLYFELVDACSDYYIDLRNNDVEIKKIK